MNNLCLERSSVVGSICLFAICLIDTYVCVIFVEPAGFQQNTWYSLLGAALCCYNKLASRRGIAHEESPMKKFLDLAKRYRLSPHILSAVADYLNSVSG